MLLYRHALIFVTLVSCSTIPSSEGWVYQGKDQNLKTEETRFQRDWKACDKKMKIADQTNKDYKLDVDPKGAFELCMRTRGWQPASEVEPVPVEE